jgi:hypothetical protein
MVTASPSWRPAVRLRAMVAARSRRDATSRSPSSRDRSHSFSRSSRLVARRPDGAARRTRRRVPRGARHARVGPARERVSAFVAIASPAHPHQEPRDAAAPGRAGDAPGDLPDEGPDPEAELRARLLSTGHIATRALSSPTGRSGGSGSSGANPRPPGRPPSPVRDPPDREPLDPVLLVDALEGLVDGSLHRRRCRPRSSRGRSPSPSVRPSSGRALRGASTIVLQELLRGVHDRVVVAVTFLAMLELMKRREIVVEQGEPWGPIVARATTAEERSAMGFDPSAPPDAPLDETLESFA